MRSWWPSQSGEALGLLWELTPTEPLRVRSLYSPGGTITMAPTPAAAATALAVAAVMTLSRTTACRTPNTANCLGEYPHRQRPSNTPVSNLELPAQVLLTPEQRLTETIVNPNQWGVTKTSTGNGLCMNVCIEHDPSILFMRAY